MDGPPTAPHDTIAFSFDQGLGFGAGVAGSGKFHADSSESVKGGQHDGSHGTQKADGKLTLAETGIELELDSESSQEVYLDGKIAPGDLSKGRITEHFHVKEVNGEFQIHLKAEVGGAGLPVDEFCIKDTLNNLYSFVSNVMSLPPKSFLGGMISENLSHLTKPLHMLESRLPQLLAHVAQGPGNNDVIVKKVDDEHFDLCPKEYFDFDDEHFDGRKACIHLALNGHTLDEATFKDEDHEGDMVLSENLDVKFSGLTTHPSKLDNGSICKNGMPLSSVAMLVMQDAEAIQSLQVKSVVLAHKLFSAKSTTSSVWGLGAALVALGAALTALAVRPRQRSMAEEPLVDDVDELE